MTATVPLPASRVTRLLSLRARRQALLSMHERDLTELEQELASVEADSEVLHTDGFVYRVSDSGTAIERKGSRPESAWHFAMMIDQLHFLAHAFIALEQP